VSAAGSALDRADARPSDVEHRRPPHAVVGQLSRVEGRRLLRHPAFVAGVLLAPLMVAANAGSPWSSDAHDALGGLAPATLGPFVLLAANAAARRARRDGTEELLGAAPAPELSRTAAHLASVGWAAAVAVAVVLATAALFHWAAVDLPRWPAPGELAQGPVAVACAGVLGVALARWVPVPGAAAGAAVGLVGWQMTMSWFSPVVSLVLVDRTGRVIGVSGGSPTWHVVWLLGLGALGVAAAVLRRPRALLVAAGAGLVLLVAAGAAQLP
jgi:hypothetical protein